MSHIDWKVELRKIEREFDGLPAMPSPAVIKARRERELREKEAVDARVAQLSALARLSLVIALTASLPWWPYATRCGPGVVALLGAYGMVAIGGLWVATYSWRHRLAASHALALAFLMAGLVLVASQVLPRMGWARITGVDASGWSCAVASAPTTGGPVAHADVTSASAADAGSMDASSVNASSPDAGSSDAGTTF
jgi:hypothetical protein